MHGLHSLGGFLEKTIIMYRPLEAGTYTKRLMERSDLVAPSKPWRPNYESEIVTNHKQVIVLAKDIKLMSHEIPKV